MKNADVLCFSHLRWHFVFQRPNHLMVRCAKDRRVFFVEEPVSTEAPPHIQCEDVAPRLTIVTPHLRASSGEEEHQIQRHLLDAFVRERDITNPLLWFYTPMALPLAGNVNPSLVVYDCMDELSAFHGAPTQLLDRERQLFARADLVFTGGHSLYEAKRAHHPAVHAFPSSVDAEHFQRARARSADPPDQAGIGAPRVGYFGVIDERLDLALLEGAARSRPDYQFIMIGPIVKIDPASVPRAPNIHYLGGKPYAELPSYLAGWDVAMMPFALNDATRFISPTKTLEYLAAGKPIVSTAIRDVVTPYGRAGHVLIADATSFATAIDEALECDIGPHRARAAEVVRATSWDQTWAAMAQLIDESAHKRVHVHSSTQEGASCSTI